jgi:hypothetical protein
VIGIDFTVHSSFDLSAGQQPPLRNAQHCMAAFRIRYRVANALKRQDRWMESCPPCLKPSQKACAALKARKTALQPPHGFCTVISIPYTSEQLLDVFSPSPQHQGVGMPTPTPAWTAHAGAGSGGPLPDRSTADDRHAVHPA